MIRSGGDQGGDPRLDRFGVVLDAGDIDLRVNPALVM
jgi:hypothetical protein